ncbi:MAG TPA: ABC transporter permease [candidate division Zixibacteria bacterium]|nr:ABC transporter permease [candidate division Zixibacteria bacterium]
MLHLAWKNLSQNRTQFILGVGGVTLAILLMLSLDALLAGSEEDLVAYIEQSGADIFIAQKGVKNMHMASSAITELDMRLVEQIDGVATASPILFTTSIIKAGESDILSYIIGYDPDQLLGGPQKLIAGTTQLARDEAIIDRAVARNQGLSLGDKIEIFGQEFTVAGITRGLTNIVNSVSFIQLGEFQAMRGGDAISYALLTVDPDADVNAVAGAIMAQDVDVQALSMSDFSREERQIIKDMSVEILNIMNMSGLLIGLAVTALTLYTSTLRKRQEYGVLKAIGARNGNLYGVVITQAFLSLSLGFLGAVWIVWLMGQLLPLVAPGIAMSLTSTGLIRVLTLSVIIGILAALAPAWQLSRLDPAQVFRG